MLGRSLKVAQRRRWLWLQLAAPKRTRRKRPRLWCQDAIADFDSVCICLSASVFGFFALPRHFSICLPISGSFPSFELAPIQEILHRRFQQREQSDPNPVGYRFSHARRPILQETVPSLFENKLHKSSQSSHLLQLSPNWQPMAPTIATKTKAKTKIISAVLFFISVGFRAPDSSSSVCGQMKNFSQP